MNFNFVLSPFTKNLCTCIKQEGLGGSSTMHTHTVLQCLGEPKRHVDKYGKAENTHNYCHRFQAGAQRRSTLRSFA